MSFVERHALWSAAQREAAQRMLEEVTERGLQVVRFSFADQHGILRGKAVAASELAGALANGVSITTTLLAKDTSHKTAFPVWTRGGGFGMDEMQGGADALMIADPTTFRVLPWAPDTGWVQCETWFGNGKPVPFDTRRLARATLERLAQAGYEYMAGLEIEFHVFKLADAKLRPEHAGQPGEPPEVMLLTQGYQYLTELRYDAIDPVMDILRRELAPLGLPLRSFEVEYGPSQLEVTLGALPGLGSADAMVLFRSAAKQILRRHGYHATFMCRPKLPNAMSCGWHLHQSLRRIADGANAFVPAQPNGQLSEAGMHWLGGLLAHAEACTALSTPTLNGYKRYRPFVLAPDRIIWGRDNRGVMLRVLGGADDAGTRIENRAGEPAANPYLYFASQVVAGIDGLAHRRDPGPSADAPYETQAARLPATLGDALAALQANDVLREGLGGKFVDYFCHLKRAEIARFNLEVSDWEQREYFELY